MGGYGIVLATEYLYMGHLHLQNLRYHHNMFFSVEKHLPRLRMFTQQAPSEFDYTLVI